MSGPINDGGPAFPVPQELDGQGMPRTAQECNGMSLRDWFAGQAVNGLIAQTVRPVSAATLAAEAFKVADAMLTERAKAGQP